MKTGNELDINTLSWVKSEIDETLKQARSALEAYVEEPEDESRLQFCLNYLHQVRGTLQMVELYGASMAAEEMEAVVQALLENQISNREDAYEVLIRGILQLPDYLEHLLTGHHDMPMVLLPLLNDLRAARGEALLSENALFTPDLSVQAPPPADLAGDLQSLAKKLRHHYHLGLLGWFRDQDSRSSLKRIGKVIEQLREAAGEQEINRLLWVAGGLVESLRNGGLDSSVSVKLLLGQLDRQIKRIIDNGDMALASEPPHELLKNLLYYVATSQSADDRTREVKEAFRLDEILPDARTLEHARADLAGPNAELLGTVSSVLLEDLARVKDTLDVLMRQENPEVEGLKPLVESLEQMADTLGMIGLGLQRRLLQDQLEVLAQMTEGKLPLSEDNLMGMATAMLSLENSLKEASVAREASEEAEAGEAGEAERKLREAEHQQLLKTVIEQAAGEFGHIKDALNDFSRNTATVEVLQTIPESLDRIRGSLAILDLERAAELLARCRDYVREELLPNRKPPSDESLDVLADAISSIEYYLESLAGKWGHPETILDISENSLRRLDALRGAQEDATVPDLAQPDFGEPDISLVTAAPEDEDDTLVNLDAPEEDTLQNLVTPANVEEEPSLEIEGEELSLELSMDDLSMEDLSLELSLNSAAVDLEGDDATLHDISLADLEASGLTQISGAGFTLDEDADDSLSITLNNIPLADAVTEPPETDSAAPDVTEIPSAEDDTLTLSIEGFEDEGEASSQELDAPADEEILADAPTLTLNVSGDALPADSLEPLAGGDDAETLMMDLAATYGDSVSAPPTDEVELVEAEASIPEPQPEDTSPAAGSPEAAAAPEADAAAPAPETETPEAGETPPASPAPMAMELPEDIDEEIVEIFLEEAEEEYQNISRLLPAWQANPQDEATLKDLRRAFHTLKGSGRLVGAKDVGEFAWAFENMLNRVIDGTIEATPVMFELLQRARETLPALFELFKRNAAPQQPVFALMGYADDLAQGKTVELPAAETAGESPEAVPESGAEAEPAEAAEPEAPTPLPDIDPALLDIYRKEVQTHLDTLREYLRGWDAGKERAATDALLRALHTLTGSSRTTGVEAISGLCGAFEHYVKDLQAAGRPLDAEGASLLQDVVNFVSETMPVLDQPGGQIGDNSRLCERLDALHEALRAELSGASITMPAPETLPEAPAESAPPPRDYDEELLEIFIEEGEEILEQSDNTLMAWRENPDDREALEALQRQLHTLKGGARMAGVVEIGDLGHNIESLLTAVVDGQLESSPAMFDLLQRAQDRLVGLLEELRAGHHLEPADDLLAEVDAMLGRNREPAAESPVPEPAAAGSEPETARDDSPEAGADTEAAETPTLEPAAGVDAEPEPAPEAMPTEEPEAITVEADASAIPETESPEAEAPEAEAEPERSPAAEAPGRSAPEAEAPTVETQTGGPATRGDNVVTLKPATEAPPEPEAAMPAPAAETPPVPETPERRQAPRLAPQEQVRVRAELLDNLVNFAGEVSIYRSRLEQQTNAFRYNLRELDETVSRLRQQLRAFEIETEAQIQYRQEETLSRDYDEFDPLEFDRFTHMQQLSRGMMESLSDLDSLRAILANLTQESETLLLQQSRVNTELQEGLMRTRMVPFSSQAPRLRRIVRQTATELGKQVELKLQGMEGELDRSVLERIIPPIEHMLRNAIAHGIESPSQRRIAGKPETGTIELSFAREGSDMVLRIRDDGAGIDLDAVQRKAVERGLLEPGITVSRDVLLNMIMAPGFSTAETVNQVAGRGVGMDVVNTEVKQLGGLIDIDSEPGKGTTFTVSMPMTLSITRALMVNVGEETFAVPLLSVQGVERIRAEEMASLREAEHPVYTWLDEEFPIMSLSQMIGLGPQTPPAEGSRVPLLLVRSGEYRAAIQVDSLIGSREVVVKPVGPQLSTLRGISGATITGEGEVVLILDLGVLIRLMAATGAEELIPVAAPEPEVAQPTVMVVDDSITVRKVTSRLLARHDYEVLTAKDGVDALAQLQEVVPDVILLDVEMPRMDGYELATNVRNDERLKHVPIIMITSRTADKHRQRAMDIGVNAYLGKPFNEGELLENIRTLTGQ